MDVDRIVEAADLVVENGARLERLHLQHGVAADAARLADAEHRSRRHQVHAAVAAAEVLAVVAAVLDQRAAAPQQRLGERALVGAVDAERVTDVAAADVLADRPDAGQVLVAVAEHPVAERLFDAGVRRHAAQVAPHRRKVDIGPERAKGAGHQVALGIPLLERRAGPGAEVAVARGVDIDLGAHGEESALRRQHDAGDVSALAFDRDHLRGEGEARARFAHQLVIDPLQGLGLDGEPARLVVGLGQLAGAAGGDEAVEQPLAETARQEVDAVAEAHEGGDHPRRPRAAEADLPIGQEDRRARLRRGHRRRAARRTAAGDEDIDFVPQRHVPLKNDPFAHFCGTSGAAFSAAAFAAAAFSAFIFS